jgi:carbamoyl-phosphate synthase large subunit
LKDPLIQQFIDAPEYTVDLFADFSGRIISVVPRERLTIIGGESFVAITRKKEDIIDETIRLAQCLNIIGHATIQCFHHDGQIKFIEVNPRYGGGANLSFVAGACTPLFLIQLLSKKVVDPCIGNFKNNFMMLRYTQDIFMSEEEMSQVERYL